MNLAGFIISKHLGKQSWLGLTNPVWKLWDRFYSEIPSILMFSYFSPKIILIIYILCISNCNPSPSHHLLFVDQCWEGLWEFPGSLVVKDLVLSLLWLELLLWHGFDAWPGNFCKRKKKRWPLTWSSHITCPSLSIPIYVEWRIQNENLDFASLQWFLIVFRNEIKICNSILHCVVPASHESPLNLMLYSITSANMHHTSFPALDLCVYLECAPLLIFV